MPVTKEKEAIVASLKEEMTSAKGAVFTSYSGLTVAQDTNLRKTLRAAGIRYHVAKNTMLSFAAKEAGLDGLVSHFSGTTAIATSKEDVVAPAKVISEFIKKNKLDTQGILTIKVGLAEGRVIDAKEVDALASLPSREVLIAKALGSMQAPISNTVGVLSGIIRKAVYALDAIRKQKEAAA